jgi:hypothetical protein
MSNAVDRPTRPTPPVLHLRPRYPQVAARVTHAAELQAVAAEFAEQGWPAQVEGDGLTAEYSAPSAGPPPWHVYRITPPTLFAFGIADPYGATKFELTR